VTAWFNTWINSFGI